MEMRSTFPKPNTTRTNENADIRQKQPTTKSLTKLTPIKTLNIKKMEEQQRNVMEKIIYLNTDDTLPSQTSLEQNASGEPAGNKNHKTIHVTNSPKRTQMQEGELHDEDDQFIEVKKKRNRGQEKVSTDDRTTQRNPLEDQKRRLKNIGTAEDDFNKVNEDEAKSKKIWLFISKAKKHVTVEKLLDYISKKTNMEKETIHVKKVQTWFKIDNNNCFLVGVDLSLKELVYTPNFWPKGIMYSRFDFRKGQHFLDNFNKGKEINKNQENTSDF